MPEPMDYAVRSDPYARYADLRDTPIERQPYGTYVVSNDAVQALYHDTRVTSDMSKRPAPRHRDGGEAQRGAGQGQGRFQQARPAAP